MQLPKDLLSESYRKPNVILCQTNKDKVCKLDVTDLQATIKFNGYSEMSFNIASVYTDLITGEQKRTPYYDYIEGLRLVYLEGFGYFQLQDPEIYGDGIQEYKSINAYSLEYSLSQRYLDTFIINMGDAGDTIGSIDGVVLYNPLDVEHSLLHLVLQKAYGWTIGHVDAELASQGRSFQIDRESIYDFIMNDMCDTFKCYVEFDTINNAVNVYSENEVERFIGYEKKKSFIYDGTTNVFSLPDGFNLNNNSVVKINNRETNMYYYNKEENTITCNDILNNQDEIVVLTCENEFQLKNDVSDTTEVTINGHPVMQYSYNSETKIISFTTPPAVGDIIEITNEFKKKYETDVVIAFENLSNEMRVNYSADDIKTVLTVKGADDLNIRSVNFGLPSIMNLDYYCTPEWMGEKLYNEYLAYMDKQDKYMSGFYSEDVSGATEESFNVTAYKQEFAAESSQDFIAIGTRTYFNVNGNVQYFNIDRLITNVNVIAESKEYTIIGRVDTFNQPQEQSGGDIISKFQLSDITNKIISVKVDGEYIDKSQYVVNDTILQITDQSILNYGGTVTIEYADACIALNNATDQIISVTTNGDAVTYSVQDSNIIINNDIHIGDIVSVEYIDRQSDLSKLPYQNKTICSVTINDINANYTFDDTTGILTILDTLSVSDTISVKMVNQHFTLSQVKDKLISVKIDGAKIDDYDFSQQSGVLTINTLPQLCNGVEVSVESIDEYFAIDTSNRKIVSVIVDDVSIDISEFSYENGRLIITSDKLSATSNIQINFVNNVFNIQLPDGAYIGAVTIDGTGTTNYSFDKLSGKLTIYDNLLRENSAIEVALINSIFIINSIYNNTLTVVKVNGVATTNYNISNDGKMTINDHLASGDKISIEFIDNHFTILNEVGSKYIVLVNGHQIPMGENGYEYDELTRILTIHVQLNDGDQVKVRANIDSTNALLIVESNAGDGEIALIDVKPTLKSYHPEVGNYVIKINGYTEILQELYDLIDSRLTEENSVPDEYKITEIKLNPENFDEAGKYLPEAGIGNLGEVYKIINQDNEGNTVAYKYYVCEMQISTYLDDDGKTQNRYTYTWEERDLVFGEDGINSLKEKIDIYSSINNVQIAAEWDQKPQDSVEYKSYKDNLANLQNTKRQLEEKQKTVEEIETKIQLVREQIQLISKDIDINTNFSPDSLDRMSLFLREDEYTDDCFCITDIDTDLDIINTQKELLVAGYKKLKTISQPTLSFSTSLKNIYAMPEFKPILHQFRLGNFIKVKIRPDFLKKARLLEIQLNFEDLSNFSCTFGDLLSAKDQGDLHADLLAQAVSAGKTVASGSSYWQKGYDVATAIDEKIRQGLIDATTSIKSNSAGQDVSWDNYGIHLRKMVNGVLDKHEGWITNNKFLYSDDNFKTTKSLFGNYEIDNETYWGVLAGCVSAGLVEGSKIIGGEICIGQQADGTYAFKVTADGTVTMNKGDTAEKLSYFNFDGDNGLIIGQNKTQEGSGEYFSKVSPEKISFCRIAKIYPVSSEPTSTVDSIYDYIFYESNENGTIYYDYYKNDNTLERIRLKENYDNPGVALGIPITYFANDTAYMKQAEIEGNLKVGTKTSSSSISLGNFKLQIESNGSLSIIAI